MTNIDFWFATQVDRDFINGSYGEGKPRLYFNNTDTYVIIDGVSFENGVLIVKDIENNIYKLKDEPDNVKFSNTLLKQWNIFDKQEGSFWEEDRCDFEPFAYNSKESLADELGLITTNTTGITNMFYGK